MLNLKSILKTSLSTLSVIVISLYENSYTLEFI